MGAIAPPLLKKRGIYVAYYLQGFLGGCKGGNSLPLPPPLR